MSNPATTFCIFAHFLQPYVERGIVPHLEHTDEKTVELFLSIQQRPGEEEPTTRMDRLLQTVREGRKVVFCVDACSQLASSAVQYCHTYGIPYGLIVKVNGSLQFWAGLHKQAPFNFVLGVGPSDQLPKLFSGAATQYDRSNQLTASTYAKDFILRQLEDME